LPEVVYGPGKRPDEISAIVTSLLRNCAGPVLLTRIGAKVAAALTVPGASYDPAARLAVWRPAEAGPPTAAIVTAGTADRPVAEEAGAVARAVGLGVAEVTDVGVAGLHRLAGRLAEIRAADVVVVVAGMEGALASVIAGLVGTPVVAVPTSTGYG